MQAPHDMHRNDDLFHTLYIYYFWRNLTWLGYGH